jgi:hypothetical protein
VCIAVTAAEVKVATGSPSARTPALPAELSACHPGASGGYCGMGNQRKVNLPVVKRFVREVVGCNCPDEVFKRVEVKAGSSAITSCSADYEINVGGRLLIVLSSESPETFSPARLQKVMAEGRSARDAAKFNRFRFILQAEDAPEVEKRLLRSFEELTPKDEKLHLHVIGRKDVPDFFKRSGR